ARSVGLVIRQGDWAAKDVDRDRFLRISRGGITEIWLVSGDERIFLSPTSVDRTVRVVGAFLDAPQLIHFTTTAALDPATLHRSTLLTARDEPSPYTLTEVRRSERSGTRGVVYEAKIDRPVEFEDVATLVINPYGPAPVWVHARDVLNEPQFTALDAELGAHWSQESTIFRTWSPVSESVNLLLFDRLDAQLPIFAVPLEHTGRGVWEVEVPGDFHGAAYQYWFRSYGQDRVTADIHSIGATADSSRSVVIDLTRTNPENWGEINPPELLQPTDEIIYEIHVRDFTVDDRSLAPNLRGTYAGLTHRGTIGSGDGAIRTGLNHLEDLGVTAVHLLPVQDFTAPPGQYNWGYWTALFNVAESNYSADASNPAQPITDLKAAIHGLHEAGIRVILDVVYNHTSTSFEFSPFDQAVPYYYFRTTIDGRLRNDAGVGNSIADERPMVRKYIGDSLEYWTREYRVDGFRFDLLGTHHPESVKEWVERIRAVRPDATIYGEPWTGGGPIYFGKGAQRGMDIAVFNDHLRNAIRGDLDGTAQGFATGPGGDVQTIRRGVMGAIDDFADHPTETVNYVSAHDNLTLWDKITLTHPEASEADKRAMHKLAHAIVLTSQGIAFIHGGADFARTKGGNHNSYNAGDEVNRFEWQRKAEYREVFEYLSGLIELRREYPELRMPDRDQVRANLRWMTQEPGAPREVMAFTVGSDQDRSLHIIYNGTATRQSVPLPEGRWHVIVDHEHAGTQSLRRLERSATLPAYSAMVLRLGD
ncbi:MAG: type I pullulanase, partial [Phycisphaerales bacterium]